MVYGLLKLQKIYTKSWRIKLTDILNIIESFATKIILVVHLNKVSSYG
jgi:hypothetical protein